MNMQALTSFHGTDRLGLLAMLSDEETGSRRKAPFSGPLFQSRLGPVKHHGPELVPEPLSSGPENYWKRLKVQTWVGGTFRTGPASPHDTGPCTQRPHRDKLLPSRDILFSDHPSPDDGNSQPTPRPGTGAGAFLRTQPCPSLWKAK